MTIRSSLSQALLLFFSPFYFFIHENRLEGRVLSRLCCAGQFYYFILFHLHGYLMKSSLIILHKGKFGFREFR